MIYLQAESSVAGTLRRESDNQASPPNSKRQKVLQFEISLSFLFPFFSFSSSLFQMRLNLSYLQNLGGNDAVSLEIRIEIFK